MIGDGRGFPKFVDTLIWRTRSDAYEVEGLFERSLLTEANASACENLRKNRLRKLQTALAGETRFEHATYGDQKIRKKIAFFNEMHFLTCDKEL